MTEPESQQVEICVNPSPSAQPPSVFNELAPSPPPIFPVTYGDICSFTSDLQSKALTVEVLPNSLSSSSSFTPVQEQPTAAWPPQLIKRMAICSKHHWLNPVHQPLLTLKGYFNALAPHRPSVSSKAVYDNK